MKILTGIDLPYAPSCGSMVLCEDIYSFLARDHEVTFAALQSQETFAGSRLPDVRQLAVAKVSHTKAYGAYVNSLLTQLRCIVRDLRPDIIHIQHLSYGMALALSRFADVPLLALCHGTDILSGMDDQFHCASAQHIADRANRVVFPSQGMLDDARRCIRIDDSKVTIVPWGLGEEYFTPSRRPQYRGGIKRLLFAGRLIRGKGVDLVLHALRELGEDYTLTIIGDGPLRQDTIDLADSLGLRGRVRFRGWLSRLDLRLEFCDHHLLIAPSQFIEAFCLVAVEAQAVGLPVAHSRVGGLAESSACDELSFASGDVRGLIAAVRYAFHDPDAWASMATASAIYARRYTLTETAGALERLSISLVQERTSTSVSGYTSW